MVTSDHQYFRNHKNELLNPHERYLSRITKTLCYGKIPHKNFTTLPVIEFASELFSNAREELTLEYLDVGEATRICRRIRIPPHTLVLALIYLDRLKVSNPKYLAKVSPTELFLMSMMIGSKFLGESGTDDAVYNDYWSHGAGIPVGEINRSEKEFLAAIEWNVFVKEEHFWKKFEDLERTVSLRQALKRGWVSYSEMALLINPQYLKVIIDFLNMAWLCLVSYTVSIVSLLGSAILVSQLLARPTHIPKATTLLATDINETMPMQTTIIDTNLLLREDAETPPVDSIIDDLETKLENCNRSFSSSVFQSISPTCNACHKHLPMAKFKTPRFDEIMARNTLVASMNSFLRQSLSSHRLIIRTM